MSASLRDRATRPSAQAPTGLGDSASIPSAGNDGPDWFEVAKALATAIMFNRGTRPEHVVGRDGRTRMGMVDLFACYCIDDAAKEFCELAGLPFQALDAPNEHQAFYMSATGRTWQDWFTDRDTIIAEAGPSPGRGKVDLKRIAQGIAARSDETAQPVRPEGQEPDPEGDAPDSQNRSNP